MRGRWVRDFLKAVFSGAGTKNGREHFSSGFWPAGSWYHLLLGPQKEDKGKRTAPGSLLGSQFTLMPKSWDYHKGFRSVSATKSGLHSPPQDLNKRTNQTEKGCSLSPDGPACPSTPSSPWGTPEDPKGPIEAGLNKGPRPTVSVPLYCFTKCFSPVWVIPHPLPQSYPSILP